jgi:uncharacterized protein
MSPKPVPQPSPETGPYWEATRRGELCLPYCAECDAVFFYPRPYCPTCGTKVAEWRRLSGRATLWSYLISERPANGYEDVPYVIALVKLEEGPTMMSNVVGVDPTPEALALDMALEVRFEARGDERVPVFAPAGAP